MVSIEIKKLFYTKKIYWFSELPFDVKNYDAVFFYACRKNVCLPGFKKIEAKTIAINLEDDHEKLWKGLNESTRRYVKKAIKTGITLKINQDYNRFLQMFQAFVKKKQFKAFPFDEESMKKIGTLFTAELHGEILAGMFAVQNSENMRFLFGGSKRLEKDKEIARLASWANKFIFWKMIEYAKEMNYKLFDFGGYSGITHQNDPKTTIDFFKRQFGGTIVTYYNYEKYYSRSYLAAKKVFRSFQKMLDQTS